MYILLTGYIPFTGSSVDSVFKNIKKKDPWMDIKEWRGISIEAKDLVIKCLEKIPAKWIKIAEVLEHDWFKNEKETYLD